MKAFVPIPATKAASRVMGQPKEAQFRLASKRSPLKRFQHFIESTDWEEKYPCHKLLDKICWGIIFMFLLYFVPFLAPIFLE